MGAVHAANVQFRCILFLCKLLATICILIIVNIVCFCTVHLHTFLFHSLSPASFYASPPDVSLNIKTKKHKGNNYCHFLGIPFGIGLLDVLNSYLCQLIVGVVDFEVSFCFDDATHNFLGVSLFFTLYGMPYLIPFLRHKRQIKNMEDYMDWKNSYQYMRQTPLRIT